MFANAIPSTDGATPRHLYPRIARPSGTDADTDSQLSLGLNDPPGFPATPALLQNLPEHRGTLVPAAEYAPADFPPPPPAVSLLHRLVDGVTERVLRRVRPPAHAQAHAQAAPLRRGEPETGPYLWRPRSPAFQHFNELVDDLGDPPSVPADALSNAMARHLKRAGYTLPPARYSAAITTGALLRRDWVEAVTEGRLNITEVLSAVAQCGEVDPACRAELASRLKVAIEATVQRVASDHAGVHAMLVRCPPVLRPPEPPGRIATLPMGPRMDAFSAAVRRLFRIPASRDGTAGQLAVCFWEALVHRSGHPFTEEEEAALIGRPVPAIEALIASGAIPAGSAPMALEAARRLDAYLQVRAALDRPARLYTTPGQPALLALCPRQARGFGLSMLMQEALNPAVLSRMIEAGELTSLLHPTLLRADRTGSFAEQVMDLLRQTLWPMLDTGLVTQAQAGGLMAQTRQRLRELSPAAFTGSESTRL